MRKDEEDQKMRYIINATPYIQHTNTIHNTSTKHIHQSAQIVQTLKHTFNTFDSSSKEFPCFTFGCFFVIN